MRSGVWRYTRHPNYFGDATQWWGLYLIAAGAADGYWTLFSPLLMTVLLLRVSGVALLERAQVRTKPQYRGVHREHERVRPLVPAQASLACRGGDARGG